MCLLQGYAALNKLRSLSKEDDRAIQLEEAMGPLFRAATALGPEATAQPSASRAHMGELLRWLLPEVTATNDIEGPLVSIRTPFAYPREHYDTFLSGREAFQGKTSLRRGTPTAC